jgi:putative oxidoreductase
MPTSTSANAALLVGRILLALIFVVSGLSKLTSIEATMGYMEAMGVPGALLWPTIALEVIGGIAIVAGYQTAITSLLLAAFTLVAGILFHSNLGDQMQFINFMKNLAITGGFLALFAAGPGAWSVDARIRGVATAH